MCAVYVSPDVSVKGRKFVVGKRWKRLFVLLNFNEETKHGG